MRVKRSGILLVNGQALPDPKAITWGLQDLDDDEGTGRNANGDMSRDRVARKRKLTIQWGILSTSDLSFILNAIKDEFFTVKYLDAEDGKARTSTMYVGDRSAPMLMRDIYTGEWLWQSLSANFIEK